jgi:peptidoglycan hydrolase CwlO-like protein
VNVYKSNAYIQFDKIIYLDRYVDENFEKLKDKRLEVKEWKKEYEALKQQVDKYKKSKVSQEQILCYSPI